jgi:hypothetical protein
MSQQEVFQLLRTLIPLLLPVLLIQLGLVVYALASVLKNPATKGPRWVWILLLIVTAFALPTGIIVAGFYLAWGRKAEAFDD